MHDTQQRCARFAAIPLAVIVVTFFLPSWDSWGDVRVVWTPASIVVDVITETWRWLWLMYPYFSAMFLLVMTAIWYNRTPTPRAHRIVLVGLSPGLAGAAFAVAMILSEPESGLLLHAVASGAAFIAAIALAVYGRRAAGWRRWMIHLAVYASLSFWLALAHVFVWLTPNGSQDQFLVGGYLFLGAWVLLAGTCAFAMLRPEYKGPSPCPVDE